MTAGSSGTGVRPFRRCRINRPNVIAPAIWPTPKQALNTTAMGHFSRANLGHFSRVPKKKGNVQSNRPGYMLKQTVIRKDISRTDYITSLAP